MNYELPIPDIYNMPTTKNLDNVDVDIHKLYFKPYETIMIELSKHAYTYLFFETENNKIYFNDNKIWNKKILFSNNIHISRNYLKNMSDNAATLIIYILKYNDKLKKIIYTGHGDTTLCSTYCGVSIITTIFLECNRELTEKIIQIQSFNIICFYKKKLVSTNQTYDYELTLCGIKNTLIDNYIDIDLKYTNIYDVYDVYYKAFSKIVEFLENNVNYIINHNIELPLEICESDDYEHNTFYIYNTLNFIKKYNIRGFDTYRYYIYK